LDVDAVDGIADLLIDGGTGTDIACYDRLADPSPTAVEIHFPRQIRAAQTSDTATIAVETVIPR
jgi:hypothetical protein